MDQLKEQLRLNQPEILPWNLTVSIWYPKDNIGIAKGNWGCGAFGREPQLKTVIQWHEASQVGLSFSIFALMLNFYIMQLFQAGK